MRPTLSRLPTASPLPWKHSLHHLPSNHQPSVLILAGDQIAVNHDVVGEDVAELGGEFELGAESAQLGFEMLGRRRDPEFITCLSVTAVMRHSWSGRERIRWSLEPL